LGTLVNNFAPERVMTVQKSNLTKMDSLVRQLDLIQHIAESGYWVTTDELCLLLDIDAAIANSLKFKETLFSFAWRNFVCTYISRQGNTCYWSIAKHLANQEPRSEEQVKISGTTPKELSDATVNGQQSLLIYNTTPAKTQTATAIALPMQNSIPPTSQTGEVLPSYFAQVENFLTPAQVQSLMKYVLEREAKFEPTSNSANDPNYRRSAFLPAFPEFSELMINRIRDMMPYIITYLGLPSFKVGDIESQLTAHNDGNYYKIHNDNGSPDSATRELTYVYYFNRQPKSFTGGELLIYDSKIENNFYVGASSYQTVQPLHNSIVFFLSRYMHEVLTVKCPSQHFANSRFTINGWVRRS
jgi:Rps23 Pro-64 3,4-dihydroxylase Tpa1-like proline 4-hydroxylase